MQGTKRSPIFVPFTFPRQTETLYSPASSVYSPLVVYSHRNVGTVNLVLSPIAILWYLSAPACCVLRWVRENGTVNLLWSPIAILWHLSAPACCVLRWVKENWVSGHGSECSSSSVVTVYKITSVPQYSIFIYCPFWHALPFILCYFTNLTTENFMVCSISQC